MRRRERESHPMRVVAGALVGSLLGLLVLALVYTAADPSRDPSDGLRHVREGLASGEGPAPWSAFIGGLLGLALSGALWGGSTTRYLGRVVGTLTFLGSGAVLGAAAGVAAYLVLWLGQNPDEALARFFVDVPRAFARGSPTLALFLMGGSSLGVLITAFTIGNDVIQRLARGIIGTLVGGLAGLVIFAVAYVAINYPGVPDSSVYILRLGEALNSLSPLQFLFAAVGGLLGLLMARYSWRFYGLLTLISLVMVVLGFLSYSFFVTLPRVDPDWKWFAIVLFAAEFFSLSMVVLYAFYTIDVATRKHWRKKPGEVAFSRFYVPKVAFQVPTYNEPPELVTATLDRLRAMDYPSDRFHIMLLDDSTDPKSAKPLEEYCRRHGIQYVHRTERGGYKAGALNHGLKFVPEDVDFFAIIDADYQVAPNYLREVMGHFADPNVAWVQTPQDYRNKDQSFLTQQYYLADAYFYRTVMPSRNEENTIIFCGTMGIVRRSALEAVGGWGEKYISEDAELSLRLLLNKWDALYINKTYGRGLIPPTFEGYKKQHYRWAFGGAKILRGHFFDILFGRLTARQRFDYFVGSVHWFEGLMVTLIALIILFLGAGELFGFRVVTHHSQEILLIGLIPFFLLTDGITRLHMVMRESMRLNLASTLKVLGMWFSVKFSNSFGAFKALIGFNMPFVRTPKAPDERIGRAAAVRRALRVTRFESTLATLLLTCALAVGLRIWLLSQETGRVVLPRLFLLVWLLYYFLIFFAAPLYAYKSYVTFRPEPEMHPRASAPGAASPGKPHAPG